MIESNVFIDNFGLKIIRVSPKELDQVVECLNKDRTVSAVSLGSLPGAPLANVDFLQQVPHISTVYIQYENINLDGLYALKNLVSLTITNQKVPVDLSKFSCLKLYSGPISSCVNYDRCQNLEVLAWRSISKKSNITGSMPSVRRLQLDLGSLEDLEVLRRFPSLAELEVSYQSKLKNIDGLLYVKNKLERLHFQSCKKIEDYKIITCLDELRVLNLEKCASIRDLDAFSSCKNLENLFFFGTEVESGDLAPLLRFPALKVVSFNNKRKYSHTEIEMNELLSKKALISD